MGLEPERSPPIEGGHAVILDQSSYQMDATISEIRGLVKSAERWRRLRPAPLGFLLMRMAGAKPDRRIVRLCGGQRLYLDPAGHLASTLANHGAFEPETSEYIMRLLRPGDCFVDVGANEGYFSVLAAQQVGNSGLVIAVEPQADLFDIVKINFAINGFLKNLVIPSALSNENGISKLVLTSGFNNGGGSLLRRYRWGTTQMVVTLSVSDFFTEYCLSDVRLMKIDIEGGEALVIPALVESNCLRNLKYLMIDFHKEILQTRGVDIDQLHSQIVDWGMQAAHGNPSRGGYVLYENRFDP